MIFILLSQSGYLASPQTLVCRRLLCATALSSHVGLGHTQTPLKGCLSVGLISWAV